MKRYNGKAPDWFSHNKYKHFKCLDSKSLCMEIEIRKKIFEHLEQTNKLSNEFKLMSDFLKEHGSYYGFYHIYMNNMNSSENKIKALKRKGNIVKKFYALVNSSFFDSLDLLNLTSSVSPLLIKQFKSKYYLPRIVVKIFENSTSPLWSFDGFYPNLEDIYESKDLKGVIEFECEVINKSYVVNQNDRELIPLSFINGITATFDEQLNFIKGLFENTQFKDCFPKDEKNNLMVNINLNAPNEEIIKSIISIVEQNRQSGDIEIFNIQIKNLKSGGYKEIVTLIEQRIFQYIDLRNWNLENNQKSTNAWYISKIFSNVPRSEPIPDNKMNDTIKPTAKKYFDDKWLNSFFHLSIPSYNSIKNNY